MKSQLLIDTLPDQLILLCVLLIGSGIAIAIMGLVLLIVPSISSTTAAWIVAGGICLTLAAAWSIISIEPRD